MAKIKQLRRTENNHYLNEKEEGEGKIYGDHTEVIEPDSYGAPSTTLIEG